MESNRSAVGWIPGTPARGKKDPAISTQKETCFSLTLQHKKTLKYPKVSLVGGTPIYYSAFSWLRVLHLS